MAELPPHVFENETVLEDAVREAFENAAASYFPDSVIKSELRETADRDGMWRRMPGDSDKKRYAKYDQTLPVTITPRVAKTVETFGTATLHDHMRDHGGFQHDRPVKTNVTLYHALPGTKASTIARAEGFPASQLHPLTPHAAGAFLGPNAALGSRPTPAAYRASPNKLHVGQRLYRVEPPRGRHHHHHRHVRPVCSELHINLQKGEIRLWLYLSEPLCQHVSADLAKPNNTAAAFARLKHLLRRPTLALKLALHERHLPPEILVVSETPNLEHKVPPWLHHAGAHLAAKIGHWAAGASRGVPAQQRRRIPPRLCIAPRRRHVAPHDDQDPGHGDSPPDLAGQGAVYRSARGLAQGDSGVPCIPASWLFHQADGPLIL